MGGGVGFRSIESKGSEFWVEMPIDVVQPPEEDAREAKAGPSVVASRGGAGRLVLYIEDNPANVSFMRDLVSTIDHIDLITVPSAELGIDLARARNPDLIVIDINLPGMSGLDALRVLRSAAETQHIPVIALSAAASQRDKQRGVEAGFHQYLTKPLKVPEFIAILEQLLPPQA